MYEENKDHSELIQAAFEHFIDKLTVSIFTTNSDLNQNLEGFL